jgi:hypothetical protein
MKLIYVLDYIDLPLHVREWVSQFGTQDMVTLYIKIPALR